VGVEKTYVMIKPDGIQRELIGKIIARIEKKGLKLVGLKLMMIDRSLAEKQYVEHKGKPFYDGLIEFMISGPVVAMCWEAENAIEIVRKIMGSTRPNEAAPGTIRGDYVINTGFNVIHASDSHDAAKREIALFFDQNELVDYELSVKHWLGL
jgi:nucleoside-diphosphate kinase